jgi:hypothetical protein
MYILAVSLFPEEKICFILSQSFVGTRESKIEFYFKYTVKPRYSVTLT